MADVPRRSGLASWLADMARATRFVNTQLTGRTIQEQDGWIPGDDGGLSHLPGAALQNNWKVEGDLFVNFRAGYGLFTRINPQGIVSLRGALETGPAAVAADVTKTIFTLPVDYRPAYAEWHSVALINQGGNYRGMVLEIKANGNVALVAGTGTGAADPTAVQRLWLCTSFWVAGFE